MLPFIEVIQLLYLIPSLTIMFFVGILICDKLVKKDKHFNNEFYPLVCYKTFNDILYHLSILFLLKFPVWGIMENLYIDNDFLASLAYFFGAATVCTSFLHSFLLATLRFIAINYPLKYKNMFKKKFVYLFILIMFIISLLISIPSFFFKSKYIYNNDTGDLTPIYLSKSISYYQFGYGIILYGILIIGAFILNIINLYFIWRRNQMRNTKKLEKTFAIYSLGTLFTTSLLEFYLITRVFGNYYENISMIIFANNSLVWIGDLGTLGDFYFFIFIRFVFLIFYTS
uniref:G_PROTEIN_RECEP_F1_2 domain-containing protein n=1 Tax=Parastrongyloides trichosuri TaxID=131310 RepID=A0A0N4Z1C3_PARTI